MTRTVQARQRGKCIFTTTCSFMREGSGGEKVVEHEWTLPEGSVEMLETRLKDNTTPLEGAGPFAMVRLGITNRGFIIRIFLFVLIGARERQRARTIKVFFSNM